MVTKKRIYEKSGVKEYWIVDPQEKTFKTWVLINGKFILKQKLEGNGKIESFVFEGIGLEIEGVFGNLV